MLPPRVLLVVLQDLHCAVFQVEVNPHGPAIPIQPLPVVPHTVEAQNLASKVPEFSMSLE